jgi:hypothetical protein
VGLVHELGLEPVRVGGESATRRHSSRVQGELKRNFSNSQNRKLRDQLEDYGDNYNVVIACACERADTNGWRAVKNKFSERQRGMMEMTEYRFIIGRHENFGGSGSQRGGLLGGDGVR